jgi:hypothetical protein
VRIPYVLFTASAPLPSLGGGVVRGRPIMPARVYGPTGDTLIDGFLDTGADDVILPAWVAPMVGIDLLPIPEHPIHLAGRPHPVRCRFASVTLRITDGFQEMYEWPGVVGFAPVPMKRGLFGHAGFLQFFDANFRGAARETILTTNGAFPGRRI